MPNRAYKKGARLEYKKVRELIKNGAEFVTRTPGSKGDWDIVAIFSDRVEFYQMKVTPTISHKNEVMEYAEKITFAPARFYLNDDMVKENTAGE